MSHEAPETRDRDEAAGMAVAVQANLVQLKVADARLRGIAPDRHPLAVASPGAVMHCRTALIDHKVLRALDAASLSLKLQETWGQYCQFCWTFHAEQPPEQFAAVAAHDMRCATALAAKCAEINALLWKIRFEHRRRSDPAFEKSDLFDKWIRTAERIPAMADDKPVRLAGNDALLAAGCTHAGMLAAARWLADRDTAWGDPALMQVTELPEL